MNENERNAILEYEQILQGKAPERSFQRRILGQTQTNRTTRRLSIF